MKTKIVYTLVSDENDFYYEQLLLSLYSLKLHNPNCKAIIVVDQKTYCTLTEKRNAIFQYITQIIPVNVPTSYSKMESSRYLKTNLREYIKGDFLFIDTDTVICNSLEVIDNCKENICAVEDWHGSQYTNDEYLWDIENIKATQWYECLESKRYNSGVMYVKDNEITHNLYKHWHSLWKISNQKNIKIDQLSLRKANYDCGFPITSLEGTWNCQISHPNSHKYWHRANIIHYYNKTNTKFIFNDERIYLSIKIQDDIPSSIKELLTKDHKILLERYRTIKGHELKYLETNMYLLYLNHPYIFKLLEGMYNVCHKIHTLLWKFVKK